MALRDNNETGSMSNTDAASAGNNDYQPQLRRRSRAARRVVEDPSDQDEEDTITVDNDIDIHPNSDADSHAEIHDNTSNKATAAPQKIVETNKKVPSQQVPLSEEGKAFKLPGGTKRCRVAHICADLVAVSNSEPILLEVSTTASCLLACTAGKSDAYTLLPLLRRSRQRARPLPRLQSLP
jgi:hypothetical protein